MTELETETKQPFFKELSDKQASFIHDRHRFSAFYGGIRNGKTSAGCLKALTLCEIFPGNVGLIGRNTYGELFDTTANEFLKLVEYKNGGHLDEGPFVKRYDRKWYNLELQNGSLVRFRYAEDVARFLGQELGFFYLDQAEEIDEEIYQQLEGRLSYWNVKRKKEFLKTYGYNPSHFGFITGNPKPGWVYELYKITGNEKYVIFEASSEDNTRNLEPGFLDNLRQSKPAQWVKRFLDGAWDVYGGQIYGEFTRDTHVKDFDLKPYWTRYIAMDWGFTHPCSILWAAVDESGRIYVYRELFVSGKLASQIAKMIHEKSEGDFVPKTDDGGIICYMPPDTNRRTGVGDNRTVLEEFQLHKVYGREGSNNVHAGILKTKELLHSNKLFVSSFCPNLIKGLLSYQWEPISLLGHYTERPLKKDDDSVDSLRYLVMAILEDRASLPGQAIEKDTYSSQILRLMLEDKKTFLEQEESYI